MFDGYLDGSLLAALKRRTEETLADPGAALKAEEAAVMAFLDGKIPLPRIVEIVQTIVDEHEPPSVVSVVHIERADAWARHRTAEIIEAR